MESHLENSKYYVPEISEFHVGFEYYLKDINSNLLEPKQVLKTNLMLLDIKQTLVKYLDREDIESLGWKLYSQELTNRSNWCCFRNTQLELYVQLNNNYFPRLLSFKSRGGDHTGNFKIEIKNKSELKKLMQQLNIK